MYYDLPVQLVSPLRGNTITPTDGGLKYLHKNSETHTILDSRVQADPFFAKLSQYHELWPLEERKMLASM